MNNEVFQQAQMAYSAKDYATALQLFAQCMQDTAYPIAAGESGLLCHQMGNCLMKLGNVTEAINAYTQATADTSYNALGSVYYNLGSAYAGLRDYENAITNFQLASADAKYNSRYKANTGLGSALLKLGKTAEAGVAFREAALDETNPDPTKALLNLGLCFMTLNRPSDAVVSYESALQFPMAAETKNKLYANLGQAYVACGQMQKAVNAFESALADKTYFLSDSASVDYQRAVGNVAQGTMEIPRAQEDTYQDESGFDVSNDPYAASDYYEPGRYEEDDYVNGGGYLPMAGETGENDAFFNASDEEVDSWARSMEVQKKHHGVGFKIFIVLLILVVIVFGVGVYAYSQGHGYPSQATVIEKLFSDPASAKGEVFVSSLSDSDLTTMLQPVVTDANATIDGINSSMTYSTAYVTATTPEGGSVRYQVTLSRDGLGWKISDVELYFDSQN